MRLHEPPVVLQLFQQLLVHMQSLRCADSSHLLYVHWINVTMVA